MMNLFDTLIELLTASCKLVSEVNFLHLEGRKDDTFKWGMIAFRLADWWGYLFKFGKKCR
jgi:hypothetical protein